MAVPEKLRTTPSKKRKKPAKRYQHQAGAKQPGLRGTAHINKKYELRSHEQTVSLSKGEARDLIGLKINKDISCISVSQKHKQPHAVRSGRHYRRLKTVKKCYKTNITEVSPLLKRSVRTHLIKYVKTNLLGHGNNQYRAPSKTKQSRSLSQDKVRLKHSSKSAKKNKVLTPPVITGSKMSKDGADKPDRNDDEKKRRKLSKDRGKTLESQKTTKAKPTKEWEVDPEVLRQEIEKANRTLKLTFKGRKHPSQKEIRKHLQEINQSVTKLAALSGQKKKPSKPQKSKKANEGTSYQDPDRAITDRLCEMMNKRKRIDSKVKSEPDSDSTDSQKRPTKRSKRSTVSPTDESTDDEGSEISGSEEEPDTQSQEVPETTGHAETVILEHRKRKQEIRDSKGRTGKGKDDNHHRLQQRSNDLFDHSGVNKEGRNYYRRKPPKDGGAKFKAPLKKPGNGAKLKKFPKGKMLKAAKITERQTAGKSLRPYFNGAGYQLRLAEALRNLTSLSLPEVKKTVRYRSKNGRTRPAVDPRVMYALITQRREKRSLDAFDQWNNRHLGPFPVYEDQSKIPYVCLCTEDETENRKRHPLCWMGKELKNNKEDSAKTLVNVLNFLDPAFKLGDRPGDETLFDEEGNYKMIKEEVVSEPEPDTDEPNREPYKDDESGDPEAEINIPEKAMETEDAVAEAQTVDPTEGEVAEPVEESEDEHGGADIETPDSDSDIEIIEEIKKGTAKNPAIIDIDDTATEQDPNKIKIEPKIEPDPVQGNLTPGVPPSIISIQEQLKHLSSVVQSIIKGPKIPPNEIKAEVQTQGKTPESDTDEFIRKMEKDLASTEQEATTHNTQNQGGNTASENKEPENTEPPRMTQTQKSPKTPEKTDESDTESQGNEGIEEIVSSPSSQEEVMVDPSTLNPTVSEVTTPQVKEKKKKKERNNNKKKQLHLHNTDRKARQMLVHKVPVRFPIAGNLMESEDSVEYVHKAIASVSEPGEYSGDFVTNASLLNPLENNQERATLIVEVDTAERCKQILKVAKYKRENVRGFEYYITPTPQRSNDRFVSNSDEEIHPMPQMKSKKSNLKHKHKRSSKEYKEHGSRPTNAVSTPLPNPAGINQNTPIDHIAALVSGLQNVDPVTQMATQYHREGTLDTSRMDMKMTVEFQNEQFIGGNIFDDATTPIASDQETLINTRQECIAREFDYAMEIDSYRRRAEAWSEDLRPKLERRGRPGRGSRTTDLRETCRRKSGPTDLRYSKLREGRKEDLRNFIKPKRRTGSASPLKRVSREENTGVSREEIRKWVVSKLKSSISRNKESETSDSSESNAESEDKQSKGKSSNEISTPNNQKKTQQTSESEIQPGGMKPSPSKGEDNGPKKLKKIISPIKYPEKTPTKSEKEMPPLSRLPSRGMPRSDLREELNLKPPNSKPRIDSGAGPIQNRISCNFPPVIGGIPDIPAFVPWLPGQTPINNQWIPATNSHMRWRTPHSSRPFIAGNTTSRNDGTMTGQEREVNPEGYDNTSREPDENEN